MIMCKCCGTIKQQRYNCRMVPVSFESELGICIIFCLVVSIRWGSETSQCMQTSQFPWHWFQTNWTVAISPCYPNGIKNWTAFKRKFKETFPKLSVKSGNNNSQDSHENQYADPVLNFGFTGQQYSDKCCWNLRLNCYSGNSLTK